jgi:hypothetical protein
MDLYLEVVVEMKIIVDLIDHSEDLFQNIFLEVVE